VPAPLSIYLEGPLPEDARRKGEIGSKGSLVKATDGKKKDEKKKEKKELKAR